MPDSLIENFAPRGTDNFAFLRHIGPSAAEIRGMLAELGYGSVEELVSAALPANIVRTGQMQLGEPLSQADVTKYIRSIGGRNRRFTSMIGMGYHGTIMPPPIQRNVLENPSWYTAYTPYQAEISQGRLEVLLLFQTMVCELTGLDVANASLLDEATACAEAMAMARRVSRSRSSNFFVDEGCHPQNISVMAARAGPIGINLAIGNAEREFEPGSCFGCLFQNPDTRGTIRDLTRSVSSLRKSGAVSIVAADPLSLTLVKEPGAMGADIAVGSMQRFGVPPGFGGPHAGFIACRRKSIRELPGRIVGASVDSNGRRALRLALQTREQHIRRQKAKSNICTAQVLPAVLSCLYAVYHGPEGLASIARRVNGYAETAAEAFRKSGHEITDAPFFDTICVRVSGQQQGILEKAEEQRINLRAIGDGHIGISFDETTDLEVIQRLYRVFGARADSRSAQDQSTIPELLRRKSGFLEHPEFKMNRCEAGMTRFMRRLADKDLALDRTMIPLGSCTMKLNAAAEMAPISWPEFTDIHPFAPDDQTSGYREMIADLSEKLCEITGFDDISLQPNSGAQGEFAGLMAIRGYHKSNGDGQRNCCLIPKSAHGTNAASAQMAGMKVVEVATESDGTIDLEDFAAQADRCGEQLSATMITYPSTHGVFEDTVIEVAHITHEFGGQVYMDGANLNALLGIAKPAELGADVAHLNLHKTFCIPHGGGGPGMGPIGVKSQLVPFLPGDPLEPGSGGAVSGSRFGSASILPVSWAYILMMAGNGLRGATQIAILNGNYIAHRLREKYEICYSGNNGLVAHECIVDIRRAVEGTSLTVDDVAKRLIDNGFHPPTMSWPVPGTLMIEPTESEPKAELDRFCAAMLQIADEIADVREGRSDPEDNPLVNAPHTIEDMIDDWTHPYSRAEAFFPAGVIADAKYWPPVNRIDNVWGDRNFAGKLD